MSYGNDSFVIDLGLEIDDYEFSKIRNQINNLQVKKINLDLNTKQAESKLNSIRKQIKNLSNMKVNLNGIGDGINLDLKNVNANLDASKIMLDTSKVEKSLESLASTINEIKVALGSVDDQSGMKDLLTTINEVSKSLTKVTTQFEALSKKDFNLNLDVTLGGSNTQASKKAAFDYEVTNNILPELEKQAVKLEKEFGDVGKLLSSLSNQKFLTAIDKPNENVFNILDVAMDSKAKLENRINAYKQYINLMQDFAKYKGIDISNVTSGFSKSADTLVDDAHKILTGKDQIEDSFTELKNIFGGNNTFNIEEADFVNINNQLNEISKNIQELNNQIKNFDFSKLDFSKLNFTNLETQLKNVVDSLNKIDVAVQNLSSASSINNLITSFDKLSDTLQEVFSNLNLIQTYVNNAYKQSVGNFNSGVNDINIGATQTQLENMKEALNKFGFDNSSIKDVTKDIQDMNIAITNITTKLNKDGSISITVKGIDELGRAITSVKNAKKEAGKSISETIGTSVSQSFNQEIKQSQEVVEAYKRLLEITKQIGDSNVELIGLDETKDVQRIEVLRNQLKELDLEYSNLFNKFNKSFKPFQLDNLNNAFQKVINSNDVANAKIADTTAYNELQKEIKETNVSFKELLTIGKQIDNLELNIAKLDTDKNTNEIKELTSQLDNLRKEYQKLQNELQGNLSTEQLSKLGNSFNDTQNKLKLLEAKALDAKNNLASSIRLKLDNGELESNVTQTITKFSKLSNVSDELKTDVSMLTELLDDMINPSDINDVDALINSYKQFEIALKNVNNQIKIALNEETSITSFQKLDIDKKAFSSNIDIWLKKNSAATKEFGSRIKELKAQIENCDRAKLEELKSEFKQIQRDAALAGVTMQSFGDRLRTQFSRLTTYYSASMFISEAMIGLRSMYNAVLEVDTAMTELYRVTDLTESQYESLYDNMTKSAKEYGVALNDIISSTASWVRLGFDANAANRLSEITTMYQHISDIENDVAVENLVTAYKGFQDELLGLYSGDETKAVEYIADIFNELGNKYAISAEQVGDGLTRAASALDLAGNTIQESAAMVTGITEVTQDPEKSGSALKILSLRLRGMKGQLEDLGEEVDENVENISKMQGQVLNLTHGKVNIFDENGNFKSTYEIMDGISEVFDTLNSIEQADLLETIAGKHRANDVAALIDNWNQVERAMQSAMDAEGSASKENEKYLESLQGKIDSLIASFQALSNTVLDSEWLKTGIELLTKFINFLDDLINTLGIGNTLLLSFGAGASFKLLSKSFASISEEAGGLSKLSDAIGVLELIFEKTSSKAKNFGSTISTVAKKTNGLKGVISGFWAVLSKHPIMLVITAGLALIAIFNKIHVTAEEANQTMEDSFNEYEEAKSKVEELNNELETTRERIRELENKKGLTFVEKEELEKLRESTELLQIQADIAKREQDREAEKAAGDVVEAYNKNFKHEISEEVTQDRRDWADNGGYIQNLTVNDDDVSSLIVYIEEMEKLRDACNTTTEKGQKDWENFNQEIENTKDVIDDQLLLLTDYQKKLESVSYDKLSNEQKQVLDNIRETVEYINKTVYTGDWYQNNFNDIFNNEKIAEYKQELIELAKAHSRTGISISDVAGKYPELELALGRANISLQSFVDNINSEAGIKKVATDIEEVANSVGVSLEKIFGKNGNAEFEDYIDNYITQVNTLQKALEDYSNGEFGNEDLEKLQKMFPELSGGMDDFEKNVKSLIMRLDEDAISEFAEQFDDINSEEAREQLQKLQDGVLELGDVVGNTLFSIDMQVESEGIEKLVAAMKESVSSTGLTSESIKNLKDRYKGLKDADFAKLFEETTNGIHLNTKELRKLEREYQNLRKSEINEELNDLIDKYDILTEAIGNSSDAARTSELYKQRESIINQINDLATLASQYDGLTSAYYNWENAQSNGNERDMYEGIISGKEELEEEMSRGWLDDDARAYLELLSGRDLSTSKYDELLEVYKNLNKEIEKGYTAFDFFTVDEDGNSTSEGVFNFLDVVLEKQKELGQEWVKIVDGEYVFDFGVNGDKAVAEALGISEELVQIILRAAEDAGFEVNLNSTYTELADLEDAAKQAYDALKQLKLDKYIDFELNLETSDIDKINEQIESAKTNLKLFTDSDGTVNLNVEGAEEAQTLLIALLTRKQELNAPSVMSVDTTKAETDIENVISLLQDYQRNYNNIEISTAVGADTTKAQTEIQNVLKSLDEIDEDTLISLGLNTKEFNTAIDTLLNTKVDVEAGVNLDETSLQVVQTTISSITPELMVKAGIDASAIVGYTPEDKESKVVYIVDDKEVDKYKAPVKKGVVEYTAKLNNWTVPKKYGVVEYKAKIEDAKVQVNGTANAQGTTGNAFSQGNWGTKDSGVALGGELGQELVVRGNRFFTIGDNSAEFFKYQKGDIIFNHEQTKQILENGKITKGIKRGKTFASGNAFVEGAAFSDGSGAGRHTIATVAGTYSKKGSGSDSDSKSKKEAEELKETFDWIEVAIDRIERAIDNLDLKASSAYKSWSKRNGFLKDEIIDIQKEIDIQASAEQRYLKEANKVNLDEKYKQLVRDGAIDIEIIEAIGESNVENKQELIDNINLYREWYEKSLDCKYAVDELSESLSECYETAFDNVVAQYEGMLSIIEHEKSMIDEYIAQSEAKGWVVSTKYYEALMDYEEDNIAKLQEEKQALLNSLQDGMANGGIEKGSEAWYRNMPLYLVTGRGILSNC